MSDAGIGALVLAGHTVQYVDATAKCECCSSPQAVHAADPGLCLYLPAAQPVQVKFVWVYPALHVQSEMEMLPIFEFEFELQVEQPVGLINMPAIHLQVVIVIPPEIECEFVGQSKHPLVSIYMLARQ